MGFFYILYMKQPNNMVIGNITDQSECTTSIHCMYVPTYVKELIKSALPVYEQELPIPNAIRIDDINAIKETLNIQICIDSLYYDDYTQLITDIESECNTHSTIDGITLIFNDD